MSLDGVSARLRFRCPPQDAISCAKVVCKLERARLRTGKACAEYTCVPPSSANATDRDSTSTHNSVATIVGCPLIIIVSQKEWLPRRKCCNYLSRSRDNKSVRVARAPNVLTSVREAMSCTWAWFSQQSLSSNLHLYTQPFPRFILFLEVHLNLVEMHRCIAHERHWTNYALTLLINFALQYFEHFECF